MMQLNAQGSVMHELKESALLGSVKDWDQANLTIFSHKVVSMVH